MSPDELRDFRAVHRMTQVAFSQRLGVPLLSVQEWESGKYKSSPLLRLACAALDAGLGPWSPASAPVLVDIEARSTSLPGLIAQIIALRQEGYEPRVFNLSADFWAELQRSAPGTAFAHLVEDARAGRALAGVAVEIDDTTSVPAFTCSRPV